ncbi:MAG: hypothetical protein RR290_01380 [Clostridia bacterium]
MNNSISCKCTTYIKKGNNLKLTFSNDTFSIYGDLNKGENIIIKYYGKLVESNKIILNYGYGNLWLDKTVIYLDLCTHSDEKCYCTSLELLHTETLYLCFMDNNNNWDLNGSSSYSITVEDSLNTLTKTVLDITVPEEEYISKFNFLFKKLKNKLLNFLLNIGSAFEKTLNKKNSDIY